MGIILMLIIFLGIPGVLTILSFVAFVGSFISNTRVGDYLRSKKIDIWTIIVGCIFSVLLWLFSGFRDYHEAIQVPVDSIQTHSPFHSDHLLTIGLLLLLGYIGYMHIRFKYPKLSPLGYVISMSSVFISNIIGVVVMVQMSGNFVSNDVNFDIFLISVLFTLLPLNFLIYSIILIREVVRSEELEERTYKYEILNKLNAYLVKSNKLLGIALLLSIPLMGLVTMILMLFGQEADSVIKVFTETSDWRLSQRISPPPVEVDGHYLCTVSLRGHRKIVKPVRFGVRRGTKIVVNRQLMVANAFEELIQERLPRFHKFIRYVYDKYGYPLSNLITTKSRADFVYILMKPLEYMFLITLYLFDYKPENRIKAQYLPPSFRGSLRG